MQCERLGLSFVSTIWDYGAEILHVTEVEMARLVLKATLTDVVRHECSGRIILCNSGKQTDERAKSFGFPNPRGR
jgi:hypothetical protein